jgi:hypothetical protein
MNTAAVGGRLQDVNIGHQTNVDVIDYSEVVAKFRRPMEPGETRQNLIFSAIPE